MDLKAIFEQVVTLYQRLNQKQKWVIIGTIVAVVAFISFLVVYNSTSSKTPIDDGYRVLFENLTPQDAGLIIQQLEKEQVPYRIKKEDTIEVPKNYVYEQRIKIASLGIPKTTKVGFELFDKKDFGATDFDQQIKFLRAIEGELSKTIESLSPIEKANVHIAMPKESVFVSKATPPTASVVLQIKPNMILSAKQVSGIKNLVAASVERLSPDNVKVVDDNGQPMDDIDELTQSKELARAQIRYKKEFEHNYEDKIVKILSPLVGGGDKVVAKVTIDFDFSQQKSVKEEFAPENVIRSESALEEKREGYKEKEIGGVPGAVSNIGPVQGLDDNNIKEKYEKNQVTTNYEITKTTSDITREFAIIKRVTAAVVVDGKYEKKVDDAGNEIVNFIKLSNEEVENITNIVKNSIGFNLQRGDEVTVSNFEFNPQMQKSVVKDNAAKFKDIVESYLEPIFPLLKYIIALLILYIFYKKVIQPFAEKMLEIPIEEEKKSPPIFEIDDEEDENNINRIQEMKKKVEQQLGIKGGEFNEDEVKYEVLLEKIKDIIESKPADIAGLFGALIQDELDAHNQGGHKKTQIED